MKYWGIHESGSSESPSEKASLKSFDLMRRNSPALPKGPYQSLPGLQESELRRASLKGFYVSRIFLPPSQLRAVPHSILLSHADEGQPQPAEIFTVSSITVALNQAWKPGSGTGGLSETVIGEGHSHRTSFYRWTHQIYGHERKHDDRHREARRR